MDSYLGNKTELQINLIRGILALKKEGINKFSSEMVAKKSNVSSQVGGAWTSLTIGTKSMPAMVVMRGKKIERDINGKITENIQYWGFNEEFNWVEIEKKIVNYI